MADKLSDSYFSKARYLCGGKGRRKNLLNYIKLNPWISNYDKDAKKVCGFPLVAQSGYSSMSIHMTRLWLDGEIEGISFGNNKWYYVAVDQLK